jgi:hypothetical protein
MASEAAPAAAGGEDWKAQLQLPPKDSRIRTAVSFALSLAEGGGGGGEGFGRLSFEGGTRALSSKREDRYVVSS